jgi:hypothetical protein
MNKKIIGYTFFTLSFIMWLIPVFIGFFDFSGKQMGVFITAAIVIGEVSFVISLVFLGKEFWIKIKRYSKIYWRMFLRKFS